MTLQDPRTIDSRDLVMKLVYGAAPGGHDPKVQRNLAKATMIIVGGDGEITPAEWSMLVGGGDPLRPPVDHRTGIRTSV
jgi:hypothetical protein